MKNNDKIAIVCCSNGIKLKDKYKIDMKKEIHKNYLSVLPYLQQLNFLFDIKLIHYLFLYKLH